MNKIKKLEEQLRIAKLEKQIKVGDWVSGHTKGPVYITKVHVNMDPACFYGKFISGEESSLLKLDENSRICTDGEYRNNMIRFFVESTGITIFKGCDSCSSEFYLSVNGIQACKNGVWDLTPFLPKQSRIEELKDYFHQMTNGAMIGNVDWYSYGEVEDVFTVNKEEVYRNLKWNDNRLEGFRNVNKFKKGDWVIGGEAEITKVLEIFDNSSFHKGMFPSGEADELFFVDDDRLATPTEVRYALLSHFNNYFNYAYTSVSYKVDFDELIINDIIVYRNGQWLLKK